MEIATIRRIPSIHSQSATYNQLRPLTSSLTPFPESPSTLDRCEALEPAFDDMSHHVAWYYIMDPSYQSPSLPCPAFLRLAMNKQQAAKKTKAI